MTEEDRAEYYDQHRDDPSVWTEMEDGFHVPSRARQQGGLSSTVTVRFAPEDAAKLRQLAERLELSYSDVIREAVRQVIEPRFVIDRAQSNVTYTNILSFGVLVGRNPPLNALESQASVTATMSTPHYEAVAG